MFNYKERMIRKIGECVEVSRSSNAALARSNEMLAEKIEAATKADVEARDRVNISLEEYNHMKNHIHKLETENHRLQHILGKIDFPFKLNVIPDTISIRYNSDPMDLMVGVEIRFKIDDLDFRNAVMNGEISL